MPQACRLRMKRAWPSCPPGIFGRLHELIQIHVLKGLLQLISLAIGALDMKPETGDKVRLKIRSHFGVRGVIEALGGEALVVRLDGSGRKIRVNPGEVTNYSLAARKAWKTEPHRRVGRPPGMRLCDRVSVTLRIDRDLWEQFQKAQARGAIEDRTAIINEWLREKLADLERGKG